MRNSSVSTYSNHPTSSFVRIVEGDPLEAVNAIREADRQEQAYHARGFRRAAADYLRVTLTIPHGSDKDATTLVRECR